MADRRKGDRRDTERREFRQEGGRRDASSAPRRQGWRRYSPLLVGSALFITLVLVHYVWLKGPRADAELVVEQSDRQLRPFLQRARLSLLAQPGLGEPGAGPLAADQVLVRGEDRRAVVALADRLEQQVLSSRVLPAAMELLGLAHLLLGDEYAARSAFEQLQARGTQAQCHRAQLSLGVLAIRNSLRQPSPEDRRFALQHALSYFAPLAAQLQTPLLADALFNQAVTLTLLGRTESARGVTKRLAELEGGSLRQARLREWVATGAAVSLLLPSEGLPTIDGDVPR